MPFGTVRAKVTSLGLGDVQIQNIAVGADNDVLIRVALQDGGTHEARFLITAVGPLSAPTMPRIPGVESFKGVSCHTARWPKEGIDYAGKRVAVIGTGATGVQTIQEVAKTAGHLTIFQRTPNWCVPLHNRPIPKDEMAAIRKTYPDVFKRCQETFSCFVHTPDPRGTFEVTPQEREAFWEKLYAEPGFGIWVGNFADVLLTATDPWEQRGDRLFLTVLSRPPTAARRAA